MIRERGGAANGKDLKHSGRLKPQAGQVTYCSSSCRWQWGQEISSWEKTWAGYLFGGVFVLLPGTATEKESRRGKPNIYER